MPDIRGAVALSTNYPLDKAKHGSPDLHKFGQSLLDPTFVAPVPYSTIGAVGLSDEVARADHVHAFPQAAMDATTGAQTTANQALAVANGNTTGAAQGGAVYGQINTATEFSSFNPLRFSGTVATMGSSAKFFYYIRQGPMTDVLCYWAVAGDAFFPVGTLQVFVPVGLNNVSFGTQCGFISLIPAAGQAHIFFASPVSSGSGYTVLQFIKNDASTYANLSTPFSWTTGAIARLYCRYYSA